MRRKNIPMKKVQVAFSNAIKRRDCRCMIKDYEPCSGSLECSHYFTQGANPSLMFYPPNAYAQCASHHWKHHNKIECSEMYKNRLLEMGKKKELEKMEFLRSKYIKYSDELKLEIIRLCETDNLSELKQLIERELLN